MSGELSLAGFAAFLAAGVARIPEAQARQMEKAAALVEQEAKRVLGTYDYGWPHLAAATIAHKAKGDVPGLETGGMRDSVEHVSSKDEFSVGSDDDKAVWFELGTSRGQPPRPFLSGAMTHKMDEVLDLIHDTARIALNGH